MSATISLDTLNAMSDEAFVEVLADIFEHSPWVAERAAPARPFKSLTSLHKAMVVALSDASDREQLTLIRAHPDLAGKAALAGDLTDASTEEQASVGLDSLSGEEMKRFTSLNDAYQHKFGFPFIIAVKNHNKDSILAAFETRLEHDPDTEKGEALRQISEIARIRLEGLLHHHDESDGAPKKSD